MGFAKSLPKLLILFLFILIILRDFSSQIIEFFNFPFLNSSFLTTVVTLGGGLIALWVFIKQKQDFKKDAANIILLEIKNAERLLKLAKESLGKDILLEDILVMQTESWSKYKYLFVRDLDRDEWDIITNFYNKCALYDQAVFYNNSFFQKNEEQLRINLQRIDADYTKDYNQKILHAKTKAIKDKISQEFYQAIRDFQLRYMNRPSENLMYLPKKPVEDAKKYLNNLNIGISQTTIGTKLKKAAGLKD